MAHVVLRRTVLSLAVLTLFAACSSSGSSKEGAKSTTSAPTATTATASTTTTEATTTTTTAPRGTKTSPLTLGDSATVGDWEVKVTAFKADATAEVKAANQFNADPKNGMYALATVETTYEGATEGQPGGLKLVMAGGDAVQYASFDCSAVPSATPLASGPTLEKGGKAVGQVCFDHPLAANANATMFVEDLADFEHKTRAYWTP